MLHDFYIRIQQHSQGRKEGGERLQKVRWLDQDCNKCGRQLNSWDMHSLIQRKYAAKAAHGGRRAGEDGSSPPDFVIMGDSQCMDTIVLEHK